MLIKNKRTGKSRRVSDAGGLWVFAKAPLHSRALPPVIGLAALPGPGRPCSDNAVAREDDPPPISSPFPGIRLHPLGSVPSPMKASPRLQHFL